MKPQRRHEEAWLTKRARALLDDARGLVPIRAKNSQLIEGALECYVDRLRHQVGKPVKAEGPRRPVDASEGPARVVAGDDEVPYSAH